MDKALLIELFGYLGSILVVVSMLMTSVMRLRIINTIGSIIFAIYALIIRSYPTAFMNFFLVGINIYQMIRLHKRSGGDYRFTEVGLDDRFLNFLLDFYKDDIAVYFPDFDELRCTADRAYIITLGSEAVGITIGKKTGPVTLDLVLDYSTPAYRDCSVGEFEYPRLRKEGFSVLQYSGSNPQHIEYVKKVGFEPADGVYRKKLH